MDMKQLEKQEQYSREKSDLGTHKVDPALHPTGTRQKGKPTANGTNGFMGTIRWKFDKITSEREAECQALIEFPLCLVVKLLWGSSLLTQEEELSPIKLSLEVQTYGRKCSLILTTMSNGFGVMGFGRL